MTEPIKKNDEIILEDSEQYHSQASSYKGIVLEQFRKCCIEGSKEMTDAGVVKRFVDGILQEIVQPDQRQIFHNSVSVLCTMLGSHIRAREHIATAIKELDKTYDNRVPSFEKNPRVIELVQKMNSRMPQLQKEARFDYNALLKMHNEAKALAVFDKHKAMLGILEQLLSELNYLEEAGASG